MREKRGRERERERVPEKEMRMRSAVRAKMGEGAKADIGEEIVSGSQLLPVSRVFDEEVVRVLDAGSEGSESGNGDSVAARRWEEDGRKMETVNTGE